MFHPNKCLTALLVGFVGITGLRAANTSISLKSRPAAGGAEVFLSEEPVAPVAGTRFRLVVEGSSDLKIWNPSAELAPSDDPTAPFKLSVGGAPASYFRLKPELQDNGGEAGGAELFGYNRVFAEELRKVGYLSVAEFAARFAPPDNYLPQVSFDPTTARYWEEFNSDPAVFNASLPTNSPDRRLYDFRLSPVEVSRFRKNGFVVSERLGSYSFADVYYRIFTDDLPVFITTDSVLHAWHWSYQAMLGELEETQLSQEIDVLLRWMDVYVGNIATEVGDGPMHDSVLDADYFISVARSLLDGRQSFSVLGQEGRVAATLTAIGKLQYEDDFPLWGEARSFDFSQFRVRGHYTRTEALGRYFQAFMWTAIADLRVAGHDATPREAGTAIILHELYKRSSDPGSGAVGLWQTLDELLRLFAGRTDSLSFRELGRLRQAAGLLNLAAANQPGAIEKFQAALLAGDYGVQSYAGAAYPTPFGPAQTQLPRLFSVTGRRFIPDGWATAQVTFDRIRWDEDLPDGKTFFGKVVRRIPLGLDVAFGVFGNIQVTPDIVAHILGGPDPTRDRLPYQHNLAAVKATFDRQDPTAWEDSIYTRWLYALRTLSQPTPDESFPQAMRTRAWAHKTVNTQLASWTQLRHDTVLYAAQPYTGFILCAYPAGFVEPRVDFWEAMRALAESTANELDKFNVTGKLPVTYYPGGGPVVTNIDLAVRKSARVALCRNFAAQMKTLRDLAAKELAGTPFTDTETLFIRSTMNSQDHEYFGKTFDGWYPTLFYKDYGQLLPGDFDTNASDRPDVLVTDVHSAPPDVTGYIGGVLHEAIGNVDLLMIAVDSGDDRMVYAGPTLSHYEFTVPGLSRLTDEEWKSRVQLNGHGPLGWDFNPPNGPVPPRPDWTEDYLAARRH